MYISFQPYSLLRKSFKNSGTQNIFNWFGYPSRFAGIGVILILLMTATKLHAQTVSKKNLLKYDSSMDSLWSRDTHINKISADGNWVFFTERFDHIENRNFLNHTSDTISLQLPETYNSEFAGNHRWFASKTSNNQLILIDLWNTKKTTYDKVSSFAFSNSGDYLAMYSQPDESLTIHNLSSGEVKRWQGIIAYTWHPRQDFIGLHSRKDNMETILRYDINKQTIKTLLSSEKSKFSHLKWSTSGNSIVFAEQIGDEFYLHHFNAVGIHKTLTNLDIHKKFPDDDICLQSLFVSDSGEKVFFYRKKNTSTTLYKSKAEVWDTDDPWIYPRMKEYEEKVLNYNLTVWFPLEDKVMPVETEAHPSAAMHVNHNYALVFNEVKNEPKYNFLPYTDLYHKDLKTGKLHLITTNQYMDSNFVTLSPGGNYIAYFQDEHWWVFDTKLKKTINLTSGMGTSFRSNSDDVPMDQRPYGHPGWSTDENYIILYDNYDIYLIKVDGSSYQKITDGRKEQISYRFSKDAVRNNYFFLTTFLNFSTAAFDLNKDIILEAYNQTTHEMGYDSWSLGKGNQNLIWGDQKLSEVLSGGTSQILVYKKERFNEPPGIYTFNTETNEEHLIYQSNPDLFKYDLGSAEMINYISPSNHTLQGSLIYPSEYDPSKKYPMIVHVYEKESRKIRDFNPPSAYELAGFNLLRFITRGYFVLYPDIAYTIQEPAVSALQSVTAAVDKVLEKGVIDSTKIGLVGHSFGGYETAFIATQTDKFAVAVAGAAVTDVANWYHDVWWEWNQMQLFRMENQQWRFGSSFYEIKDAYYRNSPLHHVENVNIPLMLWTGDLDTNINYEQSINMFVALKRLRKKSNLLLYRGESHYIAGKENQIHLSGKMDEWLDTILLKK